MDWNYLKKRRNQTLVEYFKSLNIKSEDEAIQRFKDKDISNYPIDEIKTIFSSPKNEILEQPLDLSENEFINEIEKKVSSKKKNKRKDHVKT